MAHENLQQEVARWSAISCRAESRAAPEEEEKGDFPRDLFVKLKKHRGSTVN
jgi:anti-sigma factor RsiW